MNIENFEKKYPSKKYEISTSESIDLKNQIDEEINYNPEEIYSSLEEKDKKEVLNIIKELLGCNTLDGFLERLKTVKKQDNFSSLLAAHEKLPVQYRLAIKEHRATLTSMREMKAYPIDLNDKLRLYISGLLKTNSEEEYNSYINLVKEDSDFEKILDLSTSLPETEHQKIKKHKAYLDQLNKNKLIDKMKDNDSFKGFDFDNCQRLTGMFFEVLKSDNSDFVIKHLYRSINNPKTYQEFVDYSFKANRLNKEFFGDFFPKSEDVMLLNKELFVKAEKIDYQKENGEQIYFLNNNTLNNQEKINQWLTDEVFKKKFLQFIEQSRKFQEHTRGIKGDKDGYLPDIAGDNFCVVFDKNNNCIQFVYIDTMGYLERYNDGKENPSYL